MTAKMKWAIIRARNKMFTWYWTWTEKKWNRIKNKCSEKLETYFQCVENPWWSSCDKTQFSDSTILLRMQLSHSHWTNLVNRLSILFVSLQPALHRCSTSVEKNTIFLILDWVWLYKQNLWILWERESEKLGYVWSDRCRLLF